MGEKGALLITKEESTYFSTKSKKFVNTIGAGDIFVGSYLMFEDVGVANQHTLISYIIKITTLKIKTLDEL